MRHAASRLIRPAVCLCMQSTAIRTLLLLKMLDLALRARAEMDPLAMSATSATLRHAFVRDRGLMWPNMQLLAGATSGRDRACTLLATRIDASPVLTPAAALSHANSY